MNELHTRYSAASWLDYKRHIVIAGIGGAGRGIAHQLGVQGNHELYLCDPDIVESHNCIPQGYRFDDVGKSKVSACRDMILDINYSSSVNTYWSKVQLFLAERHYKYNVIATTDTMESRRYLYNWWKSYGHEWFIETRLLADVFEVYFVRKDQPELHEKYMRTLFDDSEVDEGVCTFRQTAYVSNILHGYVVGLINLYAYKELHGVEMNIPFYTRYNATLNQWEYDTGFEAVAVRIEAEVEQS